MFFFFFFLFFLPQETLARGRDGFPFEMERSQRRACSALPAARTIARFAARNASGRGVVVAKTGGGWGNELNCIMNAFLVAVATNRSLCVDRSGSRVLQWIGQPLGVVGWDDRDCGRFEKAASSIVDCDGSDLEDCFLRLEEATEVNNMPLLKITKVMNWLPESRIPSTMFLREKLKELSNNESTYFSDLVGCASSTLIRPGNRIRTLMVPYLEQFRSALASVAVHLRSSDVAMAKHQFHDGTLVVDRFQRSMKQRRSLGIENQRRRLGIDLSPGRHNCLRDNEELQRRLVNHQLHTCLLQGDNTSSRPPPSTSQHLVYFVVGDTDVEHSSWLKVGSLGPGVSIVTTPGHPLHTGRRVNNASLSTDVVRTETIKTLLDFFLLAEADFFVSNCKYDACYANNNDVLGKKCGNSFSYNVHARRSPAVKIETSIFKPSSDLDCPSLRRRRPAPRRSQG